MESVLIIDDDARVLNMLSQHLRNADFSPITAVDGQSGLQEFYSHRPCLVILDVRIPGMDGFSFLKRLRVADRTAGVPVIVLTALQAEEAKLRAFALGVDDYVTKPFSCAELVARVKAVLKRAVGDGAGQRAVSCGDLTIDLAARRVMRKGQVVELSPTEFRLLAALARQKGRPVSHEYLLGEVWGPGYVGEICHIKRYVWALRQKLEDDPASPSHLLTERGFGYRFECFPPDSHLAYT